VSSTILVLYQILATPSLEHLDRYLPLDLLRNVFLTAALFSLPRGFFGALVFAGFLMVYQETNQQSNG